MNTMDDWMGWEGNGGEGAYTCNCCPEQQTLDTCLLMIAQVYVCRTRNRITCRSSKTSSNTYRRESPDVIGAIV